MAAAQDVARRSVASRSSVEQRVVVAALGSGMKENAMWHVLQQHQQQAYTQISSQSHLLTTASQQLKHSNRTPKTHSSIRSAQTD